MDKKDVKKLLVSFKDAIWENAEELLEIIPGVGGAASKIFKVIKDSMGNYQKVEVENPPVYMECVAFCCKEGCILSERQQEKLEEIALGNYEDDDNDNLEIVCGFVGKYTDIYNEFPEPEYLDGDLGGINQEAIWFNFQEDNEFPYDDEVLKQVIDALNGLLGVDIFDRFDVAGHNESWDL